MHTRPGDCRANGGFIGQALVSGPKPTESSTQFDKLLVNFFFFIYSLQDLVKNLFYFTVERKGNERASG